MLDGVATFPDIGVEGARCVVPAGLRGTLLVGVEGAAIVRVRLSSCCG